MTASGCGQPHPFITTHGLYAHHNTEACLSSCVCVCVCVCVCDTDDQKTLEGEHADFPAVDFGLNTGSTQHRRETPTAIHSGGSSKAEQGRAGLGGAECSSSVCEAATLYLYSSRQTRMHNQLLAAFHSLWPWQLASVSQHDSTKITSSVACFPSQPGTQSL